MCKGRNAVARWTGAWVLLTGIGWPGAASAVVETFTVKDLYSNTGSLILLRTVETIPNLPACATSSWKLALDSSTDGADRIFSMLLAAKLANRTVRIGYSDTTCESSFPAAKINYVNFHNG